MKPFQKSIEEKKCPFCNTPSHKKQVTNIHYHTDCPHLFKISIFTDCKEIMISLKLPHLANQKPITLFFSSYGSCIDIQSFSNEIHVEFPAEYFSHDIGSMINMTKNIINFS